MLGQRGLMKGGELGELAQVLLDDGRIVLQEEPVQILWDEFVQTEKGSFCKHKMP